MDEDFKTNLKLLLIDAKEAIFTLEDTSWWNDNTTLSFEEYRSTYNKQLIERINTFISTHLNNELS